MDRLVVTGIGAVSPLGWGVEALWEGLLEGRSGLGPVSRFDASAFRAAVKLLAPTKFRERR